MARVRPSNMQPLRGFKSVVPGVETTEDISAVVGIALEHQNMLARRTSPWEAPSWDNNELMNFSVELQHIDRVYAVEGIEDEMLDDFRYEMLLRGEYLLQARVQHHGRHFFVMLVASRAVAPPRTFNGSGYLYVTANANVFYNVAARTVDEKGAILASLLEDGYDIILQPSSSVNPVATQHNPFRLKRLCHEAVSANQPRLAHYPAELPQTLVRSVDEFIGVREAKQKAPEFW